MRWQAEIAKRLSARRYPKVSIPPDKADAMSKAPNPKQQAPEESKAPKKETRHFNLQLEV
jgi:hypothetical protein